MDQRRQGRQKREKTMTKLLHNEITRRGVLAAAGVAAGGLAMPAGVRGPGKAPQGGGYWGSF